jgi:tRNA threonylcarbamoyladenosine biosynthesis protein TsaB
MILALDTSTRTIGIALYDGAQVLSEMIWSSHDHHTAELAPVVAEALAKAGLTPDSLQALAVALGPGSFTGLRIGLAFAKGLALVHHLAMIGIPTLDFLAASQPLRSEQMAAVLRAGRGRLAVGWYQVEGSSWKPSRKMEVLTPVDLGQAIEQPTWVCGELTAAERQALSHKRKNVLLASPAQSLRRPAYLAEMGWQRWQAGQTDDAAALAPVYLHYNDSIPG